ncbi:hypothetical protein N657DRAFT_637251 [Parathielavia appendiculata]|uniref:Uncharacterized protein n=1 Tax=Parathielavia appendiculata TaxID=2587402 RepID=A0AAN6TRK2_9PEZI|nr:hypothetical protein N657DRAFT_637251 [Parathielavia appendiculata]
MHFILTFCLFAITALHSATATEYCRCENEYWNRVFTGINQACDGFGSWPQEQYENLKSWCFQQEGYDYNSGTSYRGDVVNCYSRKYINECWWYQGCPTGCSYVNNDKRRRGWQPEADSFVTLTEYNANGEAVAGTRCGPLPKDTASRIADSFKNCTSRGLQSTNIAVACTGSQGDAGNSETMQDFHTLCHNVGGLLLDTSDSSGLATRGEDEVKVYFVDEDGKKTLIA